MIRWAAKYLNTSIFLCANTYLGPGCKNNIIETKPEQDKTTWS